MCIGGGSPHETDEVGQRRNFDRRLGVRACRGLGRHSRHLRRPRDGGARAATVGCGISRGEAARRWLGFPNPVNEKAARTVAAGVLLLAGLTLALSLTAS